MGAERAVGPRERPCRGVRGAKPLDSGRRRFLLWQQDPKIDELAQLGARQHDSPLAGSRVARVGGRSSIEKRKGIEETLRDMKRVEVAVGPQRRTVWRSLNHFIAAETQDLRNAAIGQLTVCVAYGRGTDPDCRSTDLQHIVPPERLDEARSLDEEFSLATGPVAPAFAVRLGI